MTTLLFLFLLALGFSLVLTPVTKWLGVRLGAVDMPAVRKVHLTPTPRIGGLAIFLASTVTLALTNLYNTQVSELFVFDNRTAMAFTGGLVVFGCGLWDDFRRLNPWVKLLFQILGASLAYAGGVTIGGIFLEGIGIQFGIMSYAITVFWFLLFINAVNLIDGLDGLAGGVVFFTCLLMVILSVVRIDYLAAMYFATLGGAVLGFLRYNFNPATIFLGDGGSYFLGYSVAALSIMGSVKSQVGALMLIPLLALGVPVFDTLLSPLRRWVMGQRIFKPDRGHIHHRLLAMGLSSRNAVLVLYGITLALCLLAILIVNLRNEVVGLFLVILGGGALILVRKTGYLEYLAFDKFYGWFRDVTDVAGLSLDRRTFLAVQIEAGRAKTTEDLWAHIGDALEMLKFDRAELRIKNRGNRGTAPLFSQDSSPFSNTGKNQDNSPFSCGKKGVVPHFSPHSPDSVNNLERRRADGSDAELRKETRIFKEVREQEGETVWIWARGYYRRGTDGFPDGMLKIDLPLELNGTRLLLAKDMSRDPLSYYTLRRLEHLRRTILSNLTRLQKK